MVKFTDAEVTNASNDADVTDIDGGVRRKESRKYRKTGVGAMGLKDYEAELELSDEGSLTDQIDGIQSQDNGWGKKGTNGHPHFANGEGDEGNHRVYRKTGAGASLKFGSFSMDDKDDDGEGDEGGNKDDDEEDSEEDIGNHVFFEVQKPGGRRESSVKLKTDTTHTGKKRSYRKTGVGAKLSFNMDDIDDEDEDNDEEGGDAGDMARIIAASSHPNKATFAEPSEQLSKTAPATLKSGMKSGMKSGLRSGLKSKDGTGAKKGGAIKFHETNQTVDFDNTKTVSELPKRKFRKTGAPALVLKETLGLVDDEDDYVQPNDSTGDYLDSDDKGDAKTRFTESTDNAPKIQKRYRKTGISFGSYSMDDEDEEGGGADGDDLPPSDSLLNASPAYLKFRKETSEKYQSLESRLLEMEMGLLEKNKESPARSDSPVVLDVDLSYKYGFASGGEGQPLDIWAALLLLVHVAMIVMTILYLAGSGVSDKGWMVVFVIFLIVTLAKWLSTMNKVIAKRTRVADKKAFIKAEKQEEP